MRVYALIAHDKEKSLTRHVFNSVTDYLKKSGAEVDMLDLYQQADQIPFYWHNKEKLHSFPFFQENKERFMTADRLLISFPVYWYSVPGILKCWIDLITSFAWKYEQGFYAKPLHHIQKGLFLSATMTPNWFNRFILGNPAQNQIKQTCKFIGIYQNQFYNIGSTRHLNDEKVKAHIKKILQLADSFIAN